MELRIFAAGIANSELLPRLSKELPPDSDVELRVAASETNTRSLDPTVLVAIVGSSGTALGALIAGLLKVAISVKSRKIIIQGPDGVRVEVPTDVTTAQLMAVIDATQTLREGQIIISRQRSEAPEQ